MFFDRRAVEMIDYAFCFSWMGLKIKVRGLLGWLERSTDNRSLKTIGVKQIRELEGWVVSM